LIAGVLCSTASIVCLMAGRLCLTARHAITIHPCRSIVNQAIINAFCPLFPLQARNKVITPYTSIRDIAIIRHSSRYWWGNSGNVS
jgi:hypothetical protein